MKNDDEMFQSLLSRWDTYQEKKRKRMNVLKITVPVFACFCFVIVLGVSYWQGRTEPPRISVQTEIIRQSTTSTLETTLLTTTASVHSVISTSLSTASESTKSAMTEMTTTLDTTAATFSSDPITIAEPEYTTVCQTEIQVPVTTASVMIAETITVKETVHSETGQSVSEMTAEPSTGYMCEQTETTGAGQIEIPTETASVKWEMLSIEKQYPIAQTDGEITYIYSGKTVPADMLEEYVCDANMEGTDGEIEHYCKAKAYKIKEYSESTALAILFDDSDVYYFYVFSAEDKSSSEQ
jgi:hypothetical protein